MSYDAWLEQPYQDAAEQAEKMACPKCDEQMIEETEGVKCTECGFECFPSEPDPDDARDRYREMEMEDRF